VEASHVMWMFTIKAKTYYFGFMIAQENKMMRRSVFHQIQKIVMSQVIYLFLKRQVIWNITVNIRKRFKRMIRSFEDGFPLRIVEVRYSRDSLTGLGLQILFRRSGISRHCLKPVRVREYKNVIGKPGTALIKHYLIYNHWR
jgi:hypothetical protein